MEADARRGGASAARGEAIAAGDEGASEVVGPPRRIDVAVGEGTDEVVPSIDVEVGSRRVVLEVDGTRGREEVG